MRTGLNSTVKAPKLERIIMNKKNTIFLDLDGVMFDFEKYFEEYFGVRHDTFDDPEMWKMIHEHGSFFRNLPLMPGAKEFFDWLMTLGYNVQILTGCPRQNFTIAATDKKKAVRQHLSADIQVLTVIGGKNKFVFLNQPGDILIDDFTKNLKPWEDAGGVGVHHTNFENTKKKLIEILKL